MDDTEPTVEAALDALDAELAEMDFADDAEPPPASKVPRMTPDYEQTLRDENRAELVITVKDLKMENMEIFGLELSYDQLFQLLDKAKAALLERLINSNKHQKP